MMEPERCSACGCYLGTVECGNESDPHAWDYVCNNPHCKSKKSHLSDSQKGVNR